MSLGFSLRLFIALSLINLFTLATPPSTHAVPFFGLFSNNQNSRANCDPYLEYSDEEMYNPNAYTQIRADEEDIKKDCSNWGFENFASTNHIAKTSVVCGATVEAIYDVQGEGTDSPITLNSQSSDGNVQTFNNFNLSETVREEIRSLSDAYLFIHELGSIFTHNNPRQANPQDLFENVGINQRMNSFALHVENRKNFCSQLAECRADPDADLNERLKGEPLPRCANPMNYDVYPEDPERDVIVNEADVCDQSLGELAGYEKCPAKYFVPCDRVVAAQSPPELLAASGGGGPSACSQACNPNYDPEFADKFLALNPYSRARDTVVVCQVKAPETENRENATRYEDAIFGNENKIDCQEIIVPAGLTAYCEGMLENVLSKTSYKHREKIIAEFTEAPATEEGLGSLQGPLIEWRPTWAQFLCRFGIGGECAYINRLMQYVRRINFYASLASADGDLLNICPEEIDAETYGDPNVTVSSLPTKINNQVYWANPNEAPEAYRALLTFTLEPRSHWACTALLGHLSREGAQSRAHTPGGWIKLWGEGFDNSTIASPIPLTQGGEESDQTCFNPNLPPEDIPPGSSTDQSCRINTTRLESTDKDVPAATKGAGTFARAVSLGPRGTTYSLTKAFKPFKSSENSKAYNCDWYRYTHGLPPLPDCLNDLKGFFNGQPTLPNSGTCEPGTGTYCNPEFLSQNGWGDYATDASMICTREGGRSPRVLNMSCLDRAAGNLNQYSYDFSIGLFQMNMAPIPRYDGNGQIVEIRDGRCPGAFITDMNQLYIPPDGSYPSCKINPVDILPREECEPYIHESSRYSPNFICTQAIKSCLEKYSGTDDDTAARNNSHLASQLFEAWGYDWCGPWKTNGNTCGLCN